MFAVGWSHLCAALLIISGGTKLVDPEPTRGALRAGGMPATAGAAISLGMWEIFAGTLMIGFGGPIGGAALSVTYLGFAGFVAYALRREIPIQSCGCFGRDDTPPTWIHVAVNISAAAAGAWVGVTGGGDLVTTLSGQPLWGIPYVAFVAIGVYALYLLLAELPRTMSFVRKAAA